MSTEEKLNQLRQLTAELANLGGIQALLDWDQQVNMPRGGMEARSAQAALVAGGRCAVPGEAWWMLQVVASHNK